MIQAQDVSKSYESNPVIKNINLELKQGSIFGLIGANGAGKTTLIKTLCGIYAPDTGHVRLHDKDVYNDSDVRQNIAYVPDNITFYNNFTVKDMKDFYKNIYKNWDEDRYKTLREVFTFNEKKRIKHLSKGMKTQLLLLIALSCKPEVILMDEPTSGLDPFIRKEVLNLIVQDVSSRGTSLLISTHNVSELEQICDTVGFIDKGEIKVQQDMDNLKTAYKKIQIAFKDEMSEEFKREFKPHISKKHGKIYEIIVNMDYEIFESNVKKYQPLFVEHIDMTLEEIFLFKMGDDNYVKQVTI
ncbi:ABC transporter, ATP-binding protein [Peptostreptococcaceae bacterium AS15]|nr:ABC transporter, ATP-binding protein [[Eubacterium] yurii subsp. margaretiae ATCC 43715]EJP21503.1 ABC transporter, ATP-binding protein [Peptostreptococcaceae bacterium AS15]